MSKKYYHYDCETGYKYEVPKEYYDNFNKLWELCTPKYTNTNIGNSIIYGTGSPVQDFETAFKSDFNIIDFKQQ